ncbi:3,4-dihydroxy-2-butanone-4-phosphate synthase [Sphingomonas sp. AOB5]|uniref:3,4-dihydroxy-2-butanone-4-phosphate synthase n=1 Tax=Sphingomonas sp. AOB5 TaxID=3034017 RepID=UPI0023F78794|nr:3,4-dihydroxy-2-butanone-4-phosphate synthase [Sphingomonas sp. AOB5]MDF7774768.1 3,4-dihydroxy-2-butanone-4-phosphate synthase [Sphingomonas sp. AOB5]
MENIADIAMDSIEDALHALARGEMVVVLDDKNRENEGDLIIAAEHATPEALAFIVRHTTGIVCVAIEGERADALQLDPMVRSNDDRHGTAFTVSVDARRGTSTGVSASDRAATIAALISPDTMPDDLMRPGHMFPLRARPGGVLERPGHTEAAVDLARLAGCAPAGVLCEIVRDDGAMARTPELIRFARQHGLCITTIADLIVYRREGRDRRPSVHAIPHASGLEAGAMR